MLYCRDKRSKVVKLNHKVVKLNNKVVKLNKSVYGLKQAGCRWAMHLDDAFVCKIGMEQCKADPCVFRLLRNGVVVRIVCVYVDNITFAGESEACDFLITCLLQEFKTFFFLSAHL